MAIFNGRSSNLICTLIYLCSPQYGAWAGRLISAQQGLNDLVISHKQLRKRPLPSLSLAIREDKGQQQTQPSQLTPRASVSPLCRRACSKEATARQIWGPCLEGQANSTWEKPNFHAGLNGVQAKPPQPQVLASHITFLLVFHRAWSHPPSPTGCSHRGDRH